MTEQITRSIIVRAPISQAYQVWSNFENFPKFMKHIKSVEKINDRLSRWEMEGPLGVDLEWEAETTRLEENKRVAWSSKDREDADLITSGQVTFTDLPNFETQITVMMQYVPKKGGKVGEALGKMFSDPEARLEEDLQNFKDFIEGRHDRLDR